MISIHFFLLQNSERPKLLLFWRGGSWKPTFSYVEDFTSSVSKEPGKTFPYYLDSKQAYYK